MEDQPPISQPVTPARLTPNTASVRVRRGTVSRHPVFDPPSTTLSRAGGGGALHPDSASPTDNLSVPNTFRRRRAATLTQRLFADDLYTPLGDVEPTGRGRSSSLASTGSQPARASSPVKVHIQGHEHVEGGVEARAVSPKGRRRGSSTAVRPTPASEEIDIHHAEQEVDVLEVLDQSVSTTAALANIQSAFLPNFLNRQPVCELEPPTPPQTEAQDGGTLTTSPSEQHLLEEEEEANPLDVHLIKLLKKQKRKDKAKLIARGIWTFLKTPIGVCAGIYGILVVFWGAGLVLVLVGAIPMSSYDKKLWVEIASQILTGLFCITSLFPLPWRMIDWYNVLVIWRSARITRKRRARMALPPLRDPNDLPDPPTAEFWVAPGGEKLSGPRCPPSTAPPPVKKHKKGESIVDQPQELQAIESKVGTSDGAEEEVVVLSEKEEARLRQAQVKFARSQTWYRPHTSPTHHASPIKWALWVAILMVGNSFFQALLCVAMWGWNRFDRPAWTTGCLIPLSFGCGIGAAVLIWQSGEKTKRKAEVTAAMWKLLKQDEEALEARRKAATEARAATKAAKKHHPHTMRSCGRIVVSTLLVFGSCAAATPAPAVAALELRQTSPVKIAERTVENGKSLIGPRHGDEDEMEMEMGSHSGVNNIVNNTELAKLRQSDHHHDSHVAPLLYINETQILLHHDPDPMSYLELDTLAEGGYPGVLAVHIFLMSLAFFVCLPISLFLKSAGSQLSLVAQAAFFLAALFGMLFGTTYNSLTPDLYAGSSHTKLGWVVYAEAISVGKPMNADIPFYSMSLLFALNACDVYLFGVKFKRWYCGGRYAGVAMEEEAEELVHEGKDDPEQMATSPISLEDDTTEVSWTPEASPSTPHFSHTRGSSTVSDTTLFDASHADPDAALAKTPPRKSLKAQILEKGSMAHFALMSSLVVLAYAQVITGVAVYSGSCRAQYGNGCLAHTIKGSIFVWYGFITFARYIGAFSSWGWAWNRRPDNSRPIWTAEFVECTVCFVYGATNTWMERMGKHGSAYSIKDYQHISVAVMFWFAGALGMLMESRKIRSWLAQTAIAASDRHVEDIVEPASASFSFNPFPAFIIGVTGVAMSTHHQVYQFQIDIHALWGILLGAFAAFRLMTYFFLFLRPPASILPSRPPTEALASFCLTAGGLVFILSTEQVTLGAMRAGWDDMMAFLNISIALVSIWLFWILALFALKGAFILPPTHHSIYSFSFSITGWAIARSSPKADPMHHSSHRSASLTRSGKVSPDARGRRLATYS
ncbi:hypothetical protein P7C70_g1445, partial [Phenoliferia sp. Uapishka_3]